MNRNVVRYNHMSGLTIDPFVLAEAVCLIRRIERCQADDAIRSIIYGTEVFTLNSYALASDDTSGMTKYFLIVKTSDSICKTTAEIREFELFSQSSYRNYVTLWADESTVDGAPALNLFVNASLLSEEDASNIRAAGLSMVHRRDDDGSLLDATSRMSFGLFDMEKKSNG